MKEKEASLSVFSITNPHPHGWVIYKEEKFIWLGSQGLGKGFFFGVSYHGTRHHPVIQKCKCTGLCILSFSRDTRPGQRLQPEDV